MVRSIAAYAGAALAMLVLDGAWLSFTSSRIYRPLLGNILIDGFRLAPAIIFYLLYLFGILVFAIEPAFAADRWTLALTRGLLLGLIAYGTYDLTNQATVRSWSPTITIVDMGWGTMLTGLAASAGYGAARWAAVHL